MRNTVQYVMIALTLGGCTTLSNLFNGSAATSQQVAAAENGFIAADRLAMAYMTLPPCAVPKPTGGAGAVCSDPALKAVIKTKEQLAYNVFLSFQQDSAAGKSADMAALDAAIGAMVNSIPAVATTSK